LSSSLSFSSFLTSISLIFSFSFSRKCRTQILDASPLDLSGRCPFRPPKEPLGPNRRYFFLSFLFFCFFFLIFFFFCFFFFFSLPQLIFKLDGMTLM
jgi:hypothetical protein